MGLALELIDYITIWKSLEGWSYREVGKYVTTPPGGSVWYGHRYFTPLPFRMKGKQISKEECIMRLQLKYPGVKILLSHEFTLGDPFYQFYDDLENNIKYFIKFRKTLLIK